MSEPSESQRHLSPDPRLLQANERTLLAWMRTGIALMTFGFVIARIGVWLRALGAVAHAGPPDAAGTAWIGGIFVMLGVAGNALAMRRFLVVRKAIRSARDIGDDSFPFAYAAVVTVMGAVLSGYLLVRLI